MANPQYIPPDIQAELDALNRRKAMAELAYKRMELDTPQGPVNPGGFVPRINPLVAGLAAYSQGKAAKELGDASARLAAIPGRVGKLEQDEVAAILAGANPQEQIKLARGAKFSRGQTLAKSLEDAYEKEEDRKQKDLDRKNSRGNALVGAAPGLKGVFADSTLGTLVGGNTPTEFTPRQYPDPVITNGPDGRPLYALEGDGFGKKTVKSLAGGTTVNLNPEKAAQQAAGKDMGHEREEISKLIPEHQKSVEYLRVLGRLRDAVTAGSVMGPGGEIVFNSKQAAKALGVSNVDTMSEEQAEKALLALTVDQARKVAPTSDTDIAILKMTIGTLKANPALVLRDTLDAMGQAAAKGQKFQERVRAAAKTSLQSEAGNIWARTGMRDDAPAYSPLLFQTEGPGRNKAIENWQLLAHYMAMAGGDPTEYLENVLIEGKDGQTGAAVKYPLAKRGESFRLVDDPTEFVKRVLGKQPAPVETLAGRPNSALPGKGPLQPIVPGSIFRRVQ